MKVLARPFKAKLIRVTTRKHGRGSPDPDQPRNGTDGTADGDRPAAAEADATDQPAESGGRSHSSGFAPVEPLSRWEHHAAVASAPKGGVGVDDVPLGGVNNAAFEEWTVTRQDDNRSPIYSYNDSRDELVVGADWHGPLQYTVSVARALLSPLAFEQVLTPDRLDGKAGDLDALLNGVKAELRDKRCLGYLKQAYSGEKYVKALEGGLEDLTTLTANIENGDFSEEQRDLRSETMKLAHGLIGTATGIYDLLDVDVTRVLRLPGRVTSDMKTGGRKDLQQCMVRMATIASKMGLYTQSRVQFEPRDEKREAIGKAPLVDAADQRARISASGRFKATARPTSPTISSTRSNTPRSSACRCRWSRNTTRTSSSICRSRRRSLASGSPRRRHVSWASGRCG